MATYVLVHGAYQGGWIWKPVAERLRAGGHVVFAPTLDGCAERRHALRAGITNSTHAEEVARLMFYEDLRDVILAGFPRLQLAALAMAAKPSLVEQVGEPARAVAEIAPRQPPGRGNDRFVIGNRFGERLIDRAQSKHANPLWRTKDSGLGTEDRGSIRSSAPCPSSMSRRGRPPTEWGRPAPCR